MWHLSTALKWLNSATPGNTDICQFWTNVELTLGRRANISKCLVFVVNDFYWECETGPVHVIAPSLKTCLYRFIAKSGYWPVSTRRQQWWCPSGANNWKHPFRGLLANYKSWAALSYLASLIHLSHSSPLIEDSLGCPLCFVDHPCQKSKYLYVNLAAWTSHQEVSTRYKWLGLDSSKTRLHKSRSSRSELEFDLSNFV